MYKDTRTAWAQEFDARREGWDTINKLKAQLAKVTAERDDLTIEVMKHRRFAKQDEDINKAIYELRGNK